MIPKKGMIKASDVFERIIHWWLAITCLLLVITGLGMMFHSFNFLGIPVGGLKNLKLVHNFTGILFIPALIFAILIWWKEAVIFKFPEDLEWIKCAGGYLWHVENPPETGKYNPGQKAFFLAVAGFGILMVISGLIMWFPLGLPRELVSWMYPLHALGFVAIFAFFLVHMPQVTAAGLDPFHIVGHVQNARLFPPHTNGKQQGNGKDNARKVMDVLQGFQAAHDGAYKVE